MAANILPLPWKLTAADMGAVDFGEALRKGFENYQKFHEAANTPKKLAEALYAQQLANKINKPKAEHAEEITLADLAHTRSGTALNQGNASLIPFHRKLLEAQAIAAGAGAEKAKQIANLYSSVLNEQPSEINMPRSSYVPGTGAPLYSPENISNKNNEIRPVNYKQAIVRHLLGVPAELPQEKMSREISTSNVKEQGKLDVKRAQQLKESAKDLSLAGIDIEGIHDILTGPDSLGTGIIKTLIGKAGLGSEQLGGFNERALRLQTQMTKALSSRGGEGAAKIVASGKPSTWKSTSENLGITNAYAERIKNEFNLLNQEYKGITGKDLPYTLPEYVHNIGKKINGKLFKPKTVFSSEKQFHDYISSLSPQQRQIAIDAIKTSRRK